MLSKSEIYFDLPLQELRIVSSVTIRLQGNQLFRKQQYQNWLQNQISERKSISRKHFLILPSILLLSLSRCFCFSSWIPLPYCYYYSQYSDKPSPKGQPEQLKSQTPSKLSDTENVFPCRMNGTYDQLQCLVFIPTSI